MKNNYTSDIIGVVLYALIGISTIVAGLVTDKITWEAGIGWAACALVQGTVIAVKVRLNNIIDNLLTEKGEINKLYRCAVNEWKKANDLSSRVIDKSEEILKMNSENLEDLEYLNKVVEEMQKYLSDSDLETINDKIRDTGYLFLPKDEYKLHINRSKRK